MTISSVTSKVVYVGTGSTAAAAKVFAYPFKILAAADLTVSEYDNATSAATVKTLTTDYDVSGVGVAGGGNVTLTGSWTALATSTQLVIQRVMDLTQETDYVENDAFPAETHEQAIDKLTMITQQLQEQLDRAVLADVTQTTPDLDVVASAAAAKSSATVAIAQAVLASQSAATFTTASPTFTGTTNVTTLVGTLVSTTTLTVTATANATTIKATLISAGNIYSIPWTDYSATSTLSGWSSGTVKIIRYKTIGKTIFVNFSLTGISITGDTSFTLPFASASGFSGFVACISSLDNNVLVSGGGAVSIATTSNVITLQKDMMGSAFTTTGSKSVVGGFCYEIE